MSNASFTDCSLSQNRKSGGITSNMAVYAKEYQESRNLETICEELKPTVAIGASTAAGSFTENFLRTMAKNSPRPIIFALSNPTDKAECTAEQAYNFTQVVCMRVFNSPRSLADPRKVNCNFHQYSMCGKTRGGGSAMYF